MFSHNHTSEDQSKINAAVEWIKLSHFEQLLVKVLTQQFYWKIPFYQLIYSRGVGVGGGGGRGGRVGGVGGWEGWEGGLGGGACTPFVESSHLRFAYKEQTGLGQPSRCTWSVIIS